MNTPPDEWITTQEAAELSGYHVNYIRQLLQVGKLHGRKWGQAWQVSRKALAEYLATAEKQPDKRWGPKDPIASIENVTEKGYVAS